MAIQNAGGVRTDIREGNVTYGNAYNMLPFGNVLVTLPITGAKIKILLEEALRFAFVDADGGYPYVYGLRFDVDGTAPLGSYVSNIEINSRLAGAWVPLDIFDDVVEYTIVTNDYTAGGFDGYDILGTLPQTNTFTDYVDAFIRYTDVFPLNSLLLY
jgi:5'-nucleotidase